MDTIKTTIEIKDNNIHHLGSSLVANLDKLIDKLEHIGERIRTEDVYQRQMELALTINRLVSQKKTEYMKVRTVRYRITLHL